MGPPRLRIPGASNTTYRKLKKKKNLKLIIRGGKVDCIILSVIVWVQLSQPRFLMLNLQGLQNNLKFPVNLQDDHRGSHSS